MKGIINFLRRTVEAYDKKHGLGERKLHICHSADTRNRYKMDEWKIPSDQPQCPVYKDNRCCGGCHLAPTCEHCVDCGCYGYTYSVRGGNDQSTYMRPCSDYSKYGRIGENGKFDWDYYNLQKNIANFTEGSTVEWYDYQDLQKTLAISEEDAKLLREHVMKVGILLQSPNKEGYATVKFSNSTEDKELTVSVMGLHKKYY